MFLAVYYLSYNCPNNKGSRSRCVIAIRQHEGIFGITARFKGKVPAYIFNEDNKTYLQLYFNKNNGETSRLSPLLSRKDLVEKNGYYSIAERINNIEGMQAIRQILELPSVVMNDTHMENDELYLDFRFISTYSAEVNALLASFIGKNDNFRIVEIGRPMGIRERLSRISAETPIAVVQTSSAIPEDNELIRTIAKEYPDVVAEAEGRSDVREGVRVVLYSSKPLNVDGVIEISHQSHVYEARAFEKTLIEGRRRGNEARIPRISILLGIRNGRFFDTTFVPAAEADEYISILMSIMNENRESDTILEVYSIVRDEVWEWL
ncbi:MAG: hypothetical protein ACYCT2_08390 [Thermoplasmataceae archaeon]